MIWGFHQGLREKSTSDAAALITIDWDHRLNHRLKPLLIRWIIDRIDSMNIYYNTRIKIHDNKSEY
jgi:hypothetical protein